MIMTLKGKLLGKETRTSQKGNTYTVFLMSGGGVQTLSCMISDDLVKKILNGDYDCVEGQEYCFDLDYNPSFKSFRVVDFC